MALGMIQQCQQPAQPMPIATVSGMVTSFAKRSQMQ